MQSFTKIPNEILELMPFMSRAEMLVTTILCRHTFGYHRNHCRMTLDNFVSMSGASRATVSKGTKEVKDRGLFSVHRSKWTVQKLNQNGSETELYGSSETEPKQFRNQTKTVQKLNQNSSETELHTKKESIQRKIKRKDTRTPSHYQAFEAIHSERPEQVQIMFEVLMGIVRNSRKANEVDEAAYSLIDSGYTPSQINKWFGEGAPFWYQEKSTFSKGYPPYTGNILDEAICAKIWESAGSVIKGDVASGGEADEAWAIVERQASAGKFSFSDERVKQAVRLTGWGNLTAMTSFNQSKLEKAFKLHFEEYQHAIA